MDRQTVIDILRAHEPELRRRGVTYAALFGSRARGEARADSDIDVMIDIDPKVPMSLWGFVGLANFIRDMFPVAVDVHERQALKPRVRRQAEQDAVHAF